MAGKLMGTLQADLATRVYRITSGFNDALYLVANEPSLGMYRIQEHIQTTIPKIVERKQALLQVRQEVEGACYDLEYDTQTLQAMWKVNQFPSVNASIRRAVELKKKLENLERRGRRSQTMVVPPLEVQAEYQVGSIQSADTDHDLKPKVFD